MSRLVGIIVGGVLVASGGIASETPDLLEIAHRAHVLSAVEKVLARPDLATEQRFFIQDGLDNFLAAESDWQAEGANNVEVVTAPATGASEAELQQFRPIEDVDPELPPDQEPIPEGPGTPGGDGQESSGPDENQPGGIVANPSGVLPIGGIVCLSGNELLLNGRFLVAATVQDLLGNVYSAGSCRMTDSAGYFFFFDPVNVEIPVKMLNACGGGSPPTHWIFITGLTNFGVRTTFFDLFTGITLTHTNPVGTVFQSQINQQTPFPCP